MIEIVTCLILILVVIDDLRHFRIRNLYVCLLAGAFIANSLLHGAADVLLPHGLFAGAALVLLGVAFTLKLIGGGDAKLLTVALLWIGPEGAIVFAVLLFVLTLFTIASAGLGLVPTRHTPKGRKIPFGPSIAGAWLAVIGLSLAL